MAIIVKTTNPTGLKAAIYKAIDDKKIVTWSYDSDKDFTHATSSDQWAGKAWFRPYIPTGTTDELGFKILIGKTYYPQLTDIYGIYHGRFIEMLLRHFNTQFSSAVASAKPTANDIIEKP